MIKWFSNKWMDMDGNDIVSSLEYIYSVAKFFIFLFFTLLEWIQIDFPLVFLSILNVIRIRIQMNYYWYLCKSDGFDHEWWLFEINDKINMTRFRFNKLYNIKHTLMWKSETVLDFHYEILLCQIITTVKARKIIKLTI